MVQNLILKQMQYAPASLENQVMVLYAVTTGFMNDVPVDRVLEFESGLIKYMEANHPDVGQSIVAQKDIVPETEEKLKTAIAEFKQGF